MFMHVVLEDDLADALFLENDGGYSNFLFNGWEIEVADLFARTKSANKFACVRACTSFAENFFLVISVAHVFE